MDDGKGRFITAENKESLFEKAVREGMEQQRLARAATSGDFTFHEGETVEIKGSRFVVTSIFPGGRLRLKLLPGA